jgi:hypothetical protein
MKTFAQYLVYKEEYSPGTDVVLSVSNTLADGYSDPWGAVQAIRNLAQHVQSNPRDAEVLNRIVEIGDKFLVDIKPYKAQDANGRWQNDHEYQKIYSKFMNDAHAVLNQLRQV